MVGDVCNDEKNLLDNEGKLGYSNITMFSERDKKMEDLIIEILEEFDKFSTNISSEASRELIARAVVKKVKKVYDYNIKYYLLINVQMNFVSLMLLMVVVCMKV